MRLAGAIFDLDGTIADTFAICFLTFRHTVERHGGPTFTDVEIRAQFGPSEDGMFERVVPARWQDAFTFYLSEYERHLPTCEVFAGVAAALAWLREHGVPVALVTGKSRPSALMSLKQFGLDGTFTIVETGSPAGVVKAEAIGRIVAAWRVLATWATPSPTCRRRTRPACSPSPPRGRRAWRQPICKPRARTRCSRTRAPFTRGSPADGRHWTPSRPVGQSSA